VTRLIKPQQARHNREPAQTENQPVFSPKNPRLNQFIRRIGHGFNFHNEWMTNG
jgi:hypothetical protein